MTEAAFHARAIAENLTPAELEAFDYAWREDHEPRQRPGSGRRAGIAAVLALLLNRNVLDIGSGSPTARIAPETL